MSVTMPVEKIINSITCWVKNKPNCTNVLSSIIIDNKKELAITIKNRTFAQLDLFLIQ